MAVGVFVFLLCASLIALQTTPSVAWVATLPSLHSSSFRNHPSCLTRRRMVNPSQIWIQSNKPTDSPSWVQFDDDSYNENDYGHQHDNTRGNYSSTSSDRNKHKRDIISEASDATMRWCSDFVIPLRLCPWTASSLGAQDAVRFYVVVPNKEREIEWTMEAAVYEASNQLQRDVKEGNILPSVAIAFVICVMGEDQATWDFESFYDWFFDFEDRLLGEADNNPGSIGDFITPAPFHNGWQYDTSDDEKVGAALSYEKKSPYPTVSIVCTEEIENAGEEATQKIGKQNAQTLTKMGPSALEEFYEKSVIRRHPSPEDN